MGYCTYYTLSVYKAEKDENGKTIMSDDIPSIIEDDIAHEIERMNVFDDGNITDSFYAYCKWYDHEDDMRRMSSMFPEMIFWLAGRGEESDDLWEKYFVNGRMQYCPARIEYDDFDTDKLDHKKDGEFLIKQYGHKG